MTRKEQEQIFTNGLKYILPPEALNPVVQLLVDLKVYLKISKERKTKLGDYRPPQRGYGHRISVNGNLNKYSFLVVLLHELAHLTTYNQYKHKVAPHGQEWKNEFKAIMKPFMIPSIFPDDILEALQYFMANPGASSCADPHLFKTLNLHNQQSLEEEGLCYVEDLPDGAIFITKEGRVFQKKHKRRTRFLCKEISSGRDFAFSPVAKVKHYRGH